MFLTFDPQNKGLGGKWHHRQEHLFKMNSVPSIIFIPLNLKTLLIDIAGSHRYHERNRLISIFCLTGFLRGVFFQTPSFILGLATGEDLRCANLPGTADTTCKGLLFCLGDLFGCQCAPGWHGNSCDKRKYILNPIFSYLATWNHVYIYLTLHFEQAK